MKAALAAVLGFALVVGGSGCALIDASRGDKGDAGGDDDDVAFEKAQLWALHPSLAGPGQSVMLEGELDPAGTWVEFDLHENTQPVDVLGVGRGRLDTHDLPHSVGNLAMFTDSSTAWPIRLRLSPFALGLSRFQDNYPQTSGARTMPILDQERSGLTTYVSDHYVYAIGGGDLAGLARARINADGTLSRFVGHPIALQNGRSEHVSVPVGNWFYVIGGRRDGQASNSVEQTDVVEQTGDLDGDFVEYSHSLNQARAGAAAAVVGSYLYVIGGEGDGDVLDSIERSEITEDGKLGPFEVLSGTKLTAGRSGHTVEVIGKYIYAIGGTDASSGAESVERAEIWSTGGLRPFEGYRPTNGYVKDHVSLVLGSSLYVLGGKDGDSETDQVQVAPILMDGDIGDFSSAGFWLPAPRTDASGAVVGNDLYLIGGRVGPSAEVTDTITRGPIMRDGVLENPVLIQQRLFQARSGHAVAAVGTAVYLFGGHESGGHHIESVQVELDGELMDGFGDVGEWHNAPSGACVAVLGEKILWVGGETYDAGITGRVDMSSFKDGEPLNPVLSPQGLNEARRDSACVAVGGYLYVIGGKDATALSSIERAPYSAEGTLIGSFANAGVALATARSGHSVAVLGDRVYVLGGEDTAGNPVNSIECADIQTDGSLGGFGSNGNLGSGLAHSSAVVAGPRLYLLGGWDGSNHVHVGQDATINPDGTLNNFGMTGKGLPLGRSAAAGILLGNLIYVIGGEGGEGSTEDVQTILLQ